MKEEELQIYQGPDGIVIRVKVIPRSSKTAIEGIHRGALKVRLTSPPVENAANRDLVTFLARKLKVPKSAVQIISGAKSRDKKLILCGVRKPDVLNLMPDNCGGHSPPYKPTTDN